MAELSHVVGASEPPLIEYTIGEALARAAKHWPERLALISVHQDIRWTYRELLERADRLAAAFLKLGINSGDRIGIWSPNCAEWTLTQFAAARIGAVLVTINPAYRLSEVEYTLNKVGVKLLVSAERFKNSDYVGMIEQLAPEISQRGPGSAVMRNAASLAKCNQDRGRPPRRLAVVR